MEKAQTIQDKYELTVGLEIHAELATKSKMFCGCANNSDEDRPNANTCPICMGHPGTLPVINREAVRHVLKVGLALGGTIAYDFTEFDRKNYFYPDIPKGYQLSQYKYPLISGGSLHDVAITRIHLEEDTATSQHDKGDFSIVDFNRAGVPLMELVTEPVIHSAEQAGAFARELQLLLRTLGVGEANMEKGELRVEANISVALKDAKNFGTKVEVKNLNSFRAVEKAIAYEMDRHIAILEGGEGKLVQETRGWDETTGITYSQRLKENSHDYRYFPDPDLPKLKLSQVSDCAIDVLRSEMPELPWEKRARYANDYGLKAEDIEAFVQQDAVDKAKTLSYFFEKTVTLLSTTAHAKENYQRAANYITSDLFGFARKGPTPYFIINICDALKRVSPEQFAQLITMIDANELSSRGAKDTLLIMYEGGEKVLDGNPRSIAEKNGLIQKNNTDELTAVLNTIIEGNGTVVAEYKAGKVASLQYLIGQAMKATKGSANPGLVKELLEKLLA